MDISIRPAKESDASAIVILIGLLASDMGEHSPVDTNYVLRFMQTPGTGILVAELENKVIGLISYSMRPSLYHAGESCLIEELVVGKEFRSTGIGSRLLEAVVSLASEKSCPEVSLSVMPFNTKAIEFYRQHGFTDEAVFLEKHLNPDDQ